MTMNYKTVLNKMKVWLDDDFLKYNNDVIKIRNMCKNFIEWFDKELEIFAERNIK